MKLLFFLGSVEFVLLCLFIFLLLPAIIKIFTGNFNTKQKVIWFIIVLIAPIFGSILFFLVNRKRHVTIKKI